MKLSKKKEDELYGSVHEDITQARIKISLHLKGQGLFIDSEEVDNIMYDLALKAPENALNVFKSTKP